MSKDPRKIGLENQRKSVDWCLSHPEKYGVYPTISRGKTGKIYLDSDRIIVAGASWATTDFFGLWDIVILPEEGSYNKVTTNGYPDYHSNFLWLIQVKTNFSIGSNLDYILKLKEFKVPFWAKKELHNYKTGCLKPEIHSL